MHAAAGSRRCGAGRRIVTHAWLEVGVTGAAVAALVVLVVLPIASLLLGSLTASDGLGLEHFHRALSSSLYLRPLVNSLILGSWTGLVSLLIGLPIAWLVARTDIRAKGFIRFTATMGYLTPPFLTSIAFANLFGPNAGIVNVFVRDMLGLPWLAFDIFSMSGMVLVTTLHAFPFVYLLAVGALQSIDASLEESAQILGAGRLRTALTITLPLAAPAILGGTLIAFVSAIALFGSQAIIGLPARIFTLPTRIYALFQYPPQYGLASALSLILVTITVAALYLQRAYLARRAYVTLGGQGARAHLVPLGHWRWPAHGFVLLLFLVVVAMPFATLLAVSLSKPWGLAFWQHLTLANYRFVLFEYDVTRRAIANGLVLAALAATLAVLIGAIIARIVQRTDIPGRWVLDYVSLVPLGLPGIVMAVAVLQFWLATPFPLYGTLAILLLAYVARYVPLGVRAADVSLRQIDPSLEQSARTLGASWLVTMREIALPLMRPGLFAGWLLVFVPAIQELSASILLFSSGSITLAVAVFNLYESGLSEQACALAIVNMAIIGAAVAVAHWISRGGLADRMQAVPQ
ncbi:MAG: iron ABC transporter permease [Alphaproteobacteria bacterium]|nr:iron ABC transporter permease [Alphaproteobacteria bacterium]